MHLDYGARQEDEQELPARREEALEEEEGPREPRLAPRDGPGAGEGVLRGVSERFATGAARMFQARRRAVRRDDGRGFGERRARDAEPGLAGRERAVARRAAF